MPDTVLPKEVSADNKTGKQRNKNTPILRGLIFQYNTVAPNFNVMNTVYLNNISSIKIKHSLFSYSPSITTKFAML